MNRTAIFQLLLAMAIFGSVGFFSQHSGLHAIDLIFIRSICAVVFLFAAWLYTGTCRKERWDMRELGIIAACGITNLLNWVFLFKSFELISVTISISLYHLAPILALLAGSILYKDKIGITSIAAITGCFIGTVLIMGSNGFRSTDAGWEGMLYGVFAALFYAATMLLGKSIKQTSVYAATLIQMALGALLLFPFVNPAAYGSLDAEEWLYAIVTGVVHTGFVYLLFYRSIRYLPSSVVSLLVFVDPGIAILLDIGLTGFMPSSLQAAGIVLLFGSLFAAIAAPSILKRLPLVKKRPVSR